MKKFLMIMLVLTSSVLQADNTLQQMFKLLTEQSTHKEDSAQDERVARVSLATALVHGTRAAVITAATSSVWWAIDPDLDVERASEKASLFVLPAAPWVIKYLIEATGTTLKRTYGKGKTKNIAMQKVTNKWAKAAGSILAISLMWKLVYEYDKSQ